MARNDQVSRQWHLVRELEGSRGRTIQELVQNIPRDFPRNARTIRRDLACLETVGFPLITERRDGEIRWRLMDGFRKVPGLGFSPTEIMALTFARHLLKPLEGTKIQAALQSALAKVERGLPATGLESKSVRELQGVFAFGIGPHKDYRAHRGTIDHLSTAISKMRTVQMRYFSARRNQMTRREVDPYRLWYAAGALYLVGYCHLRKDVRMFAVERIKSLTLTDHPYQMPLGFNLEEYVQDAIGVMRGKPIDVELQFEKMTAAWAKDRLWHPSQKLTRLKNGDLKMTLTVADNRELVGWILSFGGGVHVVKPASLRQAVRREAKAIGDQPEESHGRILDVRSTRKRGA